ncbi:hypothetical protein GHT06_017988 [Daphnia sinensis]|uniref:Uncharacterized protein n=1 Tax=Daphnia sinensis TaxID=1820382 RepID=A0AAD5L4C7_9CRUS|nr:hypothetical protein GHT06_017988 [Daphnia sinensis]
MLSAFPFGCQPWNRLTVIRISFLIQPAEKKRKKVSGWHLTSTVIVSSAASGSRSFVTKAGHWLMDCDVSRFFF